KLEASDPSILQTRTFGPDANYWELPQVEHADFIDAVVNRRKPAYHPEAGHRLCTALHLGHLALREGRKIGWDPHSERFTTEPEANEASILYQRTPRNWA
ncbi:MAG: gfo/Idh/MocA family oxidoreductase, partial [Verrucomicrobiota bacterium]